MSHPRAETRRQLRTHVLRRAPLANAGGAATSALIVAAVVLGLVLDAVGTVAMQLLVGAMVWGLLLWLLARQTAAWRLTLIIATAFSLFAEMLFSLGFGLYDYRFHNVPPYVPPGHTLLFMLGVATAQRLPDVAVRPLALAIVIGGVGLTLSGISSFDGLMVALFLVAYGLGHQRKTYVLMVLMALALELLGTAAGNWRWAPTVPSLGLTTHNPPLLAGVCYALFDMAVMAGSRTVHRLTGDVPAVLEPRASPGPA